MPTPKQNIRSEYRKISKLIDEIKRNGDAEMQAIVEKWRKDVVLTLAGVEKLDPLTVESLKAQLKQISDAVNEQLYKVLTENQRRLFLKGIQSVDRILKAGDVRGDVPFLNEVKLEALQKYSAEHITGLSDYARKSISTQIDLAMLGQKPVGDVIREIGFNLKSPSVFGTISRRARIIYQTEVNRINNMASADRMKQLMEQVPDLSKQWLHHHIGVPRPGHLALHLVTVPANEKFTLVGGDGVTYEVNSPGDPILPVGEIVSCHCTLRSIVGRFAK